MDSVFALCGEGFVLVVSDVGVAQSITKLAADHRKTFALDQSVLLALAGEVVDRAVLGPLLQRSVQLLRLRHARALSVAETAQLLRTRLAERLREGWLQVSGVVAGCDASGARLFWADAMGAVVEVPHGAHGYAAYFVSSVLADAWRPGLDEPAAVGIARRCVAELRARFLLDQPRFLFQLVDAQGVRAID